MSESDLRRREPHIDTGIVGEESNNEGSGRIEGIESEEMVRARRDALKYASEDEITDEMSIRDIRNFIWWRRWRRNIIDMIWSGSLLALYSIVLYMTGVVHAFMNDPRLKNIMMYISYVFLVEFIAIVVYLSIFGEDDNWEKRYRGILLVAFLGAVSWLVFLTAGLWPIYNVISIAISALAVLIGLEIVNFIPSFGN